MGRPDKECPEPKIAQVDAKVCEPKALGKPDSSGFDHPKSQAGCEAERGDSQEKHSTNTQKHSMFKIMRVEQSGYSVRERLVENTGRTGDRKHETENKEPADNDWLGVTDWDRWPIHIHSAAHCNGLCKQFALAVGGRLRGLSEFLVGAHDAAGSISFFSPRKVNLVQRLKKNKKLSPQASPCPPFAKRAKDGAPPVLVVPGKMESLANHQHQLCRRIHRSFGPQKARASG
jgi:hypothetical protein